MIDEVSPRQDCPNCGAVSEMSPRDRMFDGRYRCRNCDAIFDPFLVSKDDILLVKSDDAMIGIAGQKPPPEAPSESLCPFCRGMARMDRSTRMLDGRYMCRSCGCAFEEGAAIPRALGHEDFERPSWAISTEGDEDKTLVATCIAYFFIGVLLLALALSFAY